jgi:superfamily II DNA helicase RecQ
MLVRPSHDVEAGFNPAVLLTLENIIAPGRRSRLSPFVESAQFLKLFGEAPDASKRAATAKAIIDANGATLNVLAKRFLEFEEQKKRFSREEYADSRFLDMYLAHYFSVNVPKVQLALLDLLRIGKLPRIMNVLDIGVGTGTTAVAILDFMSALANACDLHGVEFPVDALTIQGIDSSDSCLRYAESVVGAFAHAVHQRLESREPREVEPGNARSILDRVHDWALTVQWRAHDLQDGPPDIAPAPNVVVASNVLNELERTSPQALGHFDQYLHGLGKGTISIIIEPGDEKSAIRLMTWRRNFLFAESDFQSLGPCGQEFSNGLPQECTSCWMARRESFHRTDLYSSLQGIHADLYASLQKTLPDQKRKRFSDFENDLLSWSYALLQKRPLHEDVAIRSPLPISPRVVTAREHTEHQFRYIGTFWDRRLADPSPDDFQGKSGDKIIPEYIKVCPVGSGSSRSAIERFPGFEVPPLPFGGQFRATDLKGPHRAGNGTSYSIYRPDPYGSTEIVAPANSAQTFLPAYKERQQTAIDELAFRLFGFSALRDFQHEIIGRVLTGKSVLGIAATGGGKSECFILPALLMPGVTIVVSPLRSLMTDQYEQRLKERYGLQHLATYINGEVPFHERQARLRRMELGYYKLVYFTPEQLERGWILDSLVRANKRVRITYLVLDEAHCISHWGHDFRPSYLNILHRLNNRGIEPVCIALTATASPRVREDICQELRLTPNDIYVHSSNRPEINLVVRVRRSTDQKAEDIVDELRKLQRNNERNALPGAAIVFMPHTGGSPEQNWEKTPQAGMKSSGVTKFAGYLERELRTQVSIYHGKMEDESRAEGNLTKVDQKHDDVDIPVSHPKELGDLSGRTRQGEQAAFIRGEREIMVATKGFGMGIDKPNVRLVLHRTPTANLESYAQEAGRAGRDGEPATAVLFYTPPIPQDRFNGSIGGGNHQERSDHDIQSFFVTSPYVRRCDVELMRTFLNQITRRISWQSGKRETSSLYFTNDEIIAFFDTAEAEHLYQFEWPLFEERHSRGAESPEHKAILDRGHLYHQKTDYIGRIIGAVNRIRPKLPDLLERSALISSFQETKAWLVRPEWNRLNWNAIYGSNAYFGKIFRDREINRDEFTQLAGGSDFIALANRLSMSLRDTSALLEDINQCGSGLTQVSVPSSV